MDTLQSHVGKMETRLRKLGAKLDALVIQAAAAGTEVKLDHQERLDELKAKYQLAQTALEELRTAGDESWRSFKGSVHKAWTELESAYEKAKN
jgi:porphobilinogen deaminase